MGWLIVPIFWLWSLERLLADKLAFLISTVMPEQQPELCVAPMIHALAARALDAEVEIHFAGPAVRLLVEGVADKLFATSEQEKSLGNYLQELLAEGVVLYGCSMAVANWVGREEGLIAGSQQTGATAFVVRSLDPGWKVLVY